MKKKGEEKPGVAFFLPGVAHIAQYKKGKFSSPFFGAFTEKKEK